MLEGRTLDLYVMKFEDEYQSVGDIKRRVAAVHYKLRSIWPFGRDEYFPYPEVVPNELIDGAMIETQIAAAGVEEETQHVINAKKDHRKGYHRIRVAVKRLASEPTRFVEQAQLLHRRNNKNEPSAIAVYRSVDGSTSAHASTYSEAIYVNEIDRTALTNKMEYAMEVIGPIFKAAASGNFGEADFERSINSLIASRDAFLAGTDIVVKQRKEAAKKSEKDICRRFQELSDAERRKK